MGGTIGSLPEHAMYTYADLGSFPSDGLRREIIDGELFVSPSPATRHQRLVRRLLVALDAHMASTGAGEVFPAPFDVVLADTSVVEPDLLVLLEGQGILTEKNVQGAPAIVIEVLSDPRRDLVIKRALYERFGVNEYWVVDPNADRVEIYRRAPDGYGSPLLLQASDTLTTALLPGLAIELGAIFA